MVTYEWLIGTGIAIVAVISSITIYQHGSICKRLDEKVNREVCEERHGEIDKALIKLDKMNYTLAKIETILNGRK